MEERREPLGPEEQVPIGALRPGDGETRLEARPVRSLVRELVYELSALVNAEVSLVRAEVQENVTKLQHGVASLAAGVAVLAVGLLALVAAGILALSVVWPAWLAALVIGGGVAIVGSLMVGLGRARAQPKVLKPHRTIESLRKDRELISEEKHLAKERLR